MAMENPNKLGWSDQEWKAMVAHHDDGGDGFTEAALQVWVSQDL